MLPLSGALLSNALPLTAQNGVHLNHAQVTATRTVTYTAKRGESSRYSYEGTFIARDGALFAVPPTPRRPKTYEAGRDPEKKLLKVLFSTDLKPRADPSVAGRCETRDGLRSAYSRLIEAAGAHQERRIRGTRSSPAIGRRFDCLLLVGAATGGESNSRGSIPKVRGRLSVVWRLDKSSLHGDGERARSRWLPPSTCA